TKSGGQFLNAGSVLNSGGFDSLSSTFTNLGSFTNLAGTFDNLLSTFTNLGDFTNLAGTLRNQNGTVQNVGSFDNAGPAVVRNEAGGLFANSAAFTNSGTIEFVTASTLHNSAIGSLENRGT